MRKLLLTLFLLLPLAAGAAPFEFDSPEDEARFRRLGNELRCLVCQGQSIADSNSELAMDLKAQVHRMIIEGRSDREIVDFMVARYGDFVLFKPPLRASTWLLWFGPFVLLLVGAGVVLALSRRRTPASAELTEAERARLDEILQQSEEPRE